MTIRFFSVLRLGLITGLLGGVATLPAQVFTGTSSEVMLDFGYPSLQVLDDLEFMDENGNDKIDPGEVIQISFTLENQGQYPAVGVEILPEELNRISGLDLPEAVRVGDLAPGERRKVRVGIAAEEELQAGSASFIFKILENGAYDNISVVYGVGTGTP